MDKKLLSILCCPATQQGLSLARSATLKKVNAAIDAGRLLNQDGCRLTDALVEALITEDAARLYPVNDGIPVLLESESIDLAQLVDDGAATDQPGA